MKAMLKKCVCFMLVVVLAIPYMGLSVKAEENVNKWDDYKFIDNRPKGDDTIAYNFRNEFTFNSFEEAKKEICSNIVEISKKYTSDVSVNYIYFDVPLKIRSDKELTEKELAEKLDDFNTFVDLQPVNTPDEAFFRLICSVNAGTFSVVSRRLKYENGYYFGDINFTAWLKTSENANKMREEMPEVIKSLDIEGKSEFDKIFAISKWISKNIKYGSADGYNDQLAGDTFVSRTGVCAGKANLFVYMANYVGLKAYSVSCVFHRIVLVAIDDVFYYVDPTSFNPSTVTAPQGSASPYLEGSKYYLRYDDDDMYQLKPAEHEKLIFDRINIAEDSYMKDNSKCNGEHVYIYSEELVRDPSCSSYGYTYNYCEKCGYDKIVITGKPTGHDWHVSSVIDEATCIYPEVSELKCSKCNHTKQEETKQPLGHNYIRTVTKEPTCQEGGVATYTCSRCGDAYTEPIARYPHMDVETVNWVTVKAPTCTEDGYQTKTCPYCGEVQKRTLPKRGHDWEVLSDEAATCQHGELIVTVCKRCSERESYEIGEPTEHTFGEGVVIQKGDCSNPLMVVAYTCKVCGEIVLKHDYISIEHKWDAGTKDPVNLVIIYKCEVCGEIKTEPYDGEDETTTPVATENPTTEKQTEQVTTPEPSTSDNVTTAPAPTTVKPTETVPVVEPTTTREIQTEQITTKEQGTPDVTEKETETTVPVTTTGKSEEETTTKNVAEETTTTQPITENTTTKAETTTIPETTTKYPFKIHIGDTVKVKGITYKVSKVGYGSNSEAVVVSADKKKASYNIPNTVNVKGVKCKVVEIKANTFKASIKLKKITVGKNVKVVGKNAFSGCKKLKKITIKSTVLITVGKNAVKGTDKKLIIKVPKKKIKAYKVLFKKAGLGKRKIK